MGANSKIEWTDATWNPIRARNRETGKVGFHCEHVTDACRFCYAERLNRRLGTGLDYIRQNREQVEIYLDQRLLEAPDRWRIPRRIFLSSVTDIFAPFIGDAMLDDIYSVMMRNGRRPLGRTLRGSYAAWFPGHTFLILTKHPERARRYLSRFRPDGEGWITREGRRAMATPIPGEPIFTDNNWPPRHIYLGVSVHDQPSADQFIPILLDTPAARRFISYEPALGPLDLRSIDLSGDQEMLPLGAGWLDRLDPGEAEGPRLDWVIAGGESGPHARPAHPGWFRSVRDQCAAAGVPFFFKQWGEWTSKALDGREVSVQCAYGSMAPETAWPDGTIAWGRAEDHGGDGLNLYRVGKKRAGRLLDGVEHSGFPAP